MSRSAGGGEDGGFLARWSRRKLSPAERREDELDLPAQPPAPADPVSGRALEQVDEDQMSDVELLERYELPDPENLTEADDVSRFMQSGIPTRLRNLALRRMWKLHPVLANLDGLVEYNDDYTDAATVIPNLKTTYQVGRGAAAYLQDALEKAKLLGEGEEPVEEADQLGPPDEGGTEVAAVDEDSLPEIETMHEPSAKPPSTHAVARRQHMVFSAPGSGDES